MEKNGWLEFLSSKIKSQISLENAVKTQSWAQALVALGSLGFALNAVTANTSGNFSATKILFLMIYHAFLIFGFYLPGLFQKGDKPAIRMLGIRDFGSLTVVSMVLFFYSVVVAMISSQVVFGFQMGEASNFLMFTAWINFIGAMSYLAAFAFSFSSFFFFPAALLKASERISKIPGFFPSFHAALLLLLGMGYMERSILGSQDFFEHLKISGLFWIFIASSVLWIEKTFRASVVPALSALELEVVSGRVERPDAILARFKEAFVSARLESWIRQKSRGVAEKAHAIAQQTHQALNVVDRDKPTELDLRQVEEYYRRAEQLYRKLERDNLRFLLSSNLFDLSPVEREKMEVLKDHFSRDMRNAKLDLATVRKRIDEKLVSLKNIDFRPPVLSSEVPLEEAPVSN